MLSNRYKGMVAPETRPGHNLTLTIDLDNPTMAPDQLLKRWAEMVVCVGWWA